MNRQFSIYLDAIRITAALAVFFSHLPGRVGGWFWQLSGLGHEAVVFFFVLSGYVIAFVTAQKEKSPTEYAVSRLARIYSVALPALILATALFYLGNYINSAPLDQIHINQRIIDPFVTIISALFFVNESWWEVTVFGDLPYWSLGYEVLYYVFFGILCFARGFKKVALLAIVTAIMGPSILLYLPIWLLGVFCYRLCSRLDVPVFAAYVLYIASAVLAVLFCIADVEKAINTFVNDHVGQTIMSVLHPQAHAFGADYLLALAIALNMFAFYFIGKNHVLFKEKSEKMIRFASSYTFSLYLYHAPILFFMSAIAPHETHPFVNVFSCTILTFALVVLLGTFTEKRKYVYKELFYRLIGIFWKQPAKAAVADTYQQR